MSPRNMGVGQGKSDKAAEINDMGIDPNALMQLICLQGLLEHDLVKLLSLDYGVLLPILKSGAQ